MAQAILNIVKSANSFLSSRLLANPEANNVGLAKNFAKALVQHINSVIALSVLQATEIIQSIMTLPMTKRPSLR